MAPTPATAPAGPPPGPMAGTLVGRMLGPMDLPMVEPRAGPAARHPDGRPDNPPETWDPARHDDRPSGPGDSLPQGPIDAAPCRSITGPVATRPTGPATAPEIAPMPHASPGGASGIPSNAVAMQGPSRLHAGARTETSRAYGGTSLDPSRAHPGTRPQTAGGPPPGATASKGLRAGLALLAVAGLVALYQTLPARDALGRPLPLSLAFGAAFGLVLQRTRFCFWCIARDWFERRDPRGLLGILAALAIGVAGHAAIFGAWVPDPLAGRLPPDAHVGPVSITMTVGAFVFGLGMALSGSCISAHLYRLGEGAFGSLVALAGALVGFGLGFLSWNALWLWDIHRAVVIWLPGLLGHAGALAAAWAILGALALWLLSRPVPADHAPAAPDPRHPLARRWPAVTGGVLVGLIGTLAYLRTGPLGVTAELGSIARTAAAGAGWLPATLHGLDGFAGCATLVKETLLSRNGVFVIGLVLAALASAAMADEFRPARPRAARLPRLFAGGVMLGWGAMVALGCTVGVLMSGIMAGALSGWVFLIACYGGAWLGWRLRLS